MPRIDLIQRLKRGVALALLLGAAGLPAAEATRWTEGPLRARLIEAGYTRDLKSGAWEAEVELRFYNASPTRRFHQGVQVQFVDAQDKVVGTWKTFLSLGAGLAQHRRVRAPSPLGCAGPLDRCQGLRLRLALKPGKGLEPAVGIPAVALGEEGAPPIGVPLYVAQVQDGDSLKLMGGQRLRLAGVDAPEPKGEGGKAGQPYAGEATDYLRQRVMEGPVTLAFDGAHRDSGGRWLVLLTMEDGGLVNLELLQRGLARAGAEAGGAHQAAFEQAQAQAKLAGMGLWSAKKP